MKILKKSIAVFIAALMLISVVTAASAATEQLKVNATSNLTSAVSATYNTSEDKTVTVTYKLTTSLAVVNSEGELTYDSSVLSLKSVSMPNVSNAIVNTEPANKVKFNHTVGIGEAKFASGAVFAVAEFDVVGSGETTVDLQLSNLDAEDGSSNLVDLVTDSKAVSNAFSLSTALSAPKANNNTPDPAPALSVTSKKLAAGKTYTIKVKNTTAKCTPTFTSNKKTVATVSKNGKVTALKKGTATITVKVAGKNLKFKVTVTSNPTIKVGGKKFKASKVYTVNKKGTLSVKITGKATSIKNKYKTSNKKVAKVTSKTTAKTVKIKGLKKGTSKITITVNNVKKFTIKVKVK